MDVIKKYLKERPLNELTKKMKKELEFLRKTEKSGKLTAAGKKRLKQLDDEEFTEKYR